MRQALHFGALPVHAVSVSALSDRMVRPIRRHNSGQDRKVSVSALSDRMVRHYCWPKHQQRSRSFSIRSFGSYGEAKAAQGDGRINRCFSIRSFGSYGEATFTTEQAFSLFRCFSIRSFGSYGEATPDGIACLIPRRFSIRSFGSYGEAIFSRLSWIWLALFQYPLFRIVW